MIALYCQENLFKMFYYWHYLTCNVFVYTCVARKCGGDGSEGRVLAAQVRRVDLDAQCADRREWVWYSVCP